MIGAQPDRLLRHQGCREPQYPVIEAMRRGIPEDAFVVWDINQLSFYARTHWPVSHAKTEYILRWQATRLQCKGYSFREYDHLGLQAEQKADP